MDRQALNISGPWQFPTQKILCSLQAQGLSTGISKLRRRFRPITERRHGSVVFVDIGQDDKIFARVDDVETKREYYLHSASLLDGALLQVGLCVSYSLVESPAWPGVMRAEQARVEDTRARRRGTVGPWDADRGCGCIVEGGADGTEYWFDEAAWQGRGPLPEEGAEVEFSGRRVATQSEPVADDVLLAGEASTNPLIPVPEEEPEPTPETDSSVGPSSSAGTSTGKCFILWDFDQTCNWGVNRTLAVYTAILNQLFRDGIIADIADPTTIAIGNSSSLQDTTVVDALNELDVDVELLSGRKKEQVDGHLERKALSLASLPDTTAIALISSDKGFAQMFRRLRQLRKRTILFHMADPGSKHERILRLFATDAYHLLALGAAPVDAKRYYGIISDVNHNKKFGYIQNYKLGVKHYFEEKEVGNDVEIETGEPVSFKLAPDPWHENDVMKAVQVRALHRSQVHSWKQGLDSKSTYGFIQEDGQKVFFHSSVWHGDAQHPPTPGMEVFYSEEDNPSSQNRRSLTVVGPLSCFSPPPPPPQPHLAGDARQALPAGASPVARARPRASSQPPPPRGSSPATPVGYGIGGRGTSPRPQAPGIAPLSRAQPA
eukprot:EG_transcript_6571